ncbi:hypothetical protein A1359_11580 [Methylomonas lenta]|uniref:Transmembrane protein n=1 Tax=Methylomonas lenta TaxID=980561 RepID=A0A177N9K7_9GAMM|nr:hypothetical protein [Methylomonas lenta]OAI13899.1 hypothetical protein A1359_11580 [Methylomonas lenta]
MTTTEQNFLVASSETTASGVSWSSIFAGAAAAASLSLILLILGVGLGFPVISPWTHSGVSATAIGLASILWLSFSQIAASGLGGYLSGRLRIRWTTVHRDEVYFRDTAHGLLAWAIASLAMAALLGTVIGNVLAIGTFANTDSVSTANGIAAVRAVTSQNPSHMPPIELDAGNSKGNGELGYWLDSLFRSSQAPDDATQRNYGSVRHEAAGIVVNGLRLNGLPVEDQQYLGQIVALQTGLPLADAEKRVVDVFGKLQAAIEAAEQHVKQTADSARKLAAYTALWMVVALLLGAFVASLAATFGGRQRDRVIHTDSTSFS